MTERCNEQSRNVMRDPSKQDDVKEILKEIGAAPSCQQGEYGGKTSIFGGLATAGFGGSYEIGCEQINVIVDSFYSTRANIACTLRKTSNLATINFALGQRIKLINRPGGSLDCAGGVNFKNLAQGQVLVAQTLSRDDLKQVKADIKETVMTTLDNFQKASKEFGATTKGQRSYQAAVQKMDEHFESTTVDNQINSIIANVSVGQDIDIDNWGLITGSHCNFSNESLLTLTASNILQSVTRDAFSTSVVSDFMREIKNHQDTQSKGLFAESEIGMVIGLIVILVVCYLVYRWAVSKA